MLINTTFALTPEWPFVPPARVPPSIEDAQTAPTAAEILPQLLALTPRGQAWGTDEVGSATGVSPVMSQFWTAVAMWIADVNTRDAEVASQIFPSLLDLALEDMEAELALPDKHGPLASTIAGRVATIRMRLAGPAGPAPADYIGLAALVDASITIEEPDQFQVEWSEVGPNAGEPDPLPADLAALDMLADVYAWRFWIVRALDLGPFASSSELEVALKPFVPRHLRMVVVA